MLRICAITDGLLGRLQALIALAKHPRIVLKLSESLLKDGRYLWQYSCCESLEFSIWAALIWRWWTSSSLSETRRTLFKKSSLLIIIRVVLVVVVVVIVVIRVVIEVVVVAIVTLTWAPKKRATTVHGMWRCAAHTGLGGPGLGLHRPIRSSIIFFRRVVCKKQ